MTTYEAVVVGAGPAGCLCAEELARAGLKVALVDKRGVGGTCLNRGCIPSKALLCAAEIAAKLRLLKRFGFPQLDPFEPASILNLREHAVSLTVRALESRLKKSGIELVAGEVVGADRSSIEVRTDSGTRRIGYGNLIVAVGSVSASIGG
ncbi:MAG TPA: FAD-binding protein, partial [Proteobacteria bacterium]|nr:FAD-binding protein [Pseudomonadota bacterium]